MNGRSRKLILGATAAAAAGAVGRCGLALPGGRDLPTECDAVRRPPRIRPDYSETVIPPNIAPLNFLVEEPGVEYRVRIHGAEGEDILIGSRSPSIVIPPRPWRELLEQEPRRPDRVGRLCQRRRRPLVPLRLDRE